MSRSGYYDGVELVPPLVAHGAVDARQARAIASNACTAADQGRARVLAAWSLPAGLTATRYMRPMTAYGGRSIMARIGPTPVSVYDGLRAYGLRVRLLVSSSSGTSEISIRAVGGDEPMSPTDEAEPIAKIATSSASPVWLSPSPIVIVPQPTPRDMPTVEYPSGPGVSVRVWTVRVDLYGSEYARLYGAHIAEYHDA